MAGIGPPQRPCFRVGWRLVSGQVRHNPVVKASTLALSLHIIEYNNTELATHTQWTWG